MTFCKSTVLCLQSLWDRFPGAAPLSVRGCGWLNVQHVWRSGSTVYHSYYPPKAGILPVMDTVPYLTALAPGVDGWSRSHWTVSCLTCWTVRFEDFCAWFPYFFITAVLKAVFQSKKCRKGLKFNVIKDAMSVGHCILPKRIQKGEGLLSKIHPRHCHQRPTAWHFACPGETRSSSTAPWSFSWPWWQLAHGGRCWSDDKDLELMPAAFSHFCHVITTPDTLKSSSGCFPLFFLGFLLLHRGFWKITRSTVLQVTGSLALS